MPLTTTATWPDLTAGKKAKASEVELKFDWLEGPLLPQNDGTLVTAKNTTTGYDIGNTNYYWYAGWFNYIILDGQTMSKSYINPIATRATYKGYYAVTNTLTVENSYNIASTSRETTGVYRFTFTTMLSDDDYYINLTKRGSAGFVQVHTAATTYFEMCHYNSVGTLADETNAVFYVSVTDNIA